MSTRARNVTLRNAVEHSDMATRTAAASIQVAGQIAREWRAFAGLSFGWRLWWLLTGRVHVPSTPTPAEGPIAPEPAPAPATAAP